MFGMMPGWGAADPAVTVLHVPFVGANGSTTFADYTGKTLVPFGDAALSTANYKFPTSSLHLDGSGDYVTCTDSGINLSGSDYTVAAWVYIDRTSWGAQPDCLFTSYLNQAFGRFIVIVEANGVIQFAEQDSAGTNSSFVQTTSGAIALQTWHYVEVSKQGTTGRVFVDGVLNGSFTSAVRTSFAGYLQLGVIDILSGGSFFYFLQGYMQDLLVCKTALHTANYTPPTALLDYPAA